MKFKIGDRVKAIKKPNGNPGITGKIGTVRGTGEFSHSLIAVEFDEEITRGHSCNDRCKSGHGRWCDEDSLELLKPNQKIVITSDGTETLARLYENEELVKSATAKCHADDTFDFNTRAKLAFERLIFEKKAFDWEEFVTTKIAVYLATQEEYDMFMKMCDERNITWRTGESASQLNFFDEFNEFCVGNHNVNARTKRMYLHCYSKSYSEEHGYKVLNFSDFEFPELEEPKYKPLNMKFIFTSDCTNWSDLTEGKVYEVIEGKFKDDDGDLRPTFSTLYSAEDLNKYLNYHKWHEVIE